MDFVGGLSWWTLLMNLGGGLWWWTLGLCFGSEVLVDFGGKLRDMIVCGLL